MVTARPICFILLTQAVCRAFSRAWAKTGNRIAARIAMIAITTSSSIRVKPLRSRSMTFSFRIAPSLKAGVQPCLFPSRISTRPVGGVVDPSRAGHRIALVFFPLQLRDARGIAAQVDIRQRQRPVQQVAEEGEIGARVANAGDRAGVRAAHAVAVSL